MPWYRHHNFFLLALSSTILLWPLFASALTIPVPDPVIKIPGLSDLSQIEEQPCPDLEETIGATGCLYIPWIGQYVSGLYKFAVLTSTILAVVVMMIAGFIWLTAGGNVTQIGTAKSYIGGAIMGLILMLGSYTLLNLINPELVVFKSLRIPVIKRVNLPDYIQQLYASSSIIGSCQSAAGQEITTLGGAPSPASSYEGSFNAASDLFGVSAVYLASIAAKETGGSFKTDLTSPKGAFGLMQIMPKTASDIWNHNSNLARPDACSGENDPGKGSYTDICKQYLAANPEHMIFMSAAYFSTINKRLASCNLEGNQTLMAAGYNAGPWNRDVCAGQVPKIAETVDYVRGVNTFLGSFCKGSGGTVKVDTTPPGLKPGPQR